MLNTLLNCFKIPELRSRILFTLSLLFVARLGCNIPMPGFDPLPLKSFFDSQKLLNSNQLIGLYDLFTGGAFLKCAIFGLGVMPYISASIIFQILGVLVPSLAQLQQEGEFGKQRLMQYTRYLTLLICFVQGWLLIMALSNYPEKLFPGFNTYIYGSIVLYKGQLFIVSCTLLLATGTMILTWLGDQITQRGVGNGVSLLISVGILSGLPQSIVLFVKMFTAPIGVDDNINFGFLHCIVMIILLFVVIGSMISVTQAQRKILVQYAKRIVGRKMYGGQNSFLPIKVNYVGVMPVIFASAILMFPQQFFAYLGAAFNIKLFQEWSMVFIQGKWFYYVAYGLLILVFSYFWVSIMFKPLQIANELKENGGYIPGIRPGIDTAKYLDYVMTRLTLAGSIFLTVVALLPDCLFFLYKIPYKVALFFGGTGTLIIVGVLLETMKQMETFLLQRNYEGFLSRSSLRNHFNIVSQFQKIADSKDNNFRWLLITVSLLFIFGFISYGLKSLFNL